MTLALLDTPLVMHVLSPLVEPLVAAPANNTAPPMTPGLFTVSFGDGQLDVLPQTLPAPPGFTIVPGDASLTVLPAEET